MKLSQADTNSITKNKNEKKYRKIRRIRIPNLWINIKKNETRNPTTIKYICDDDDDDDVL